jgi:hypothetical protein
MHERFGSSAKPFACHRQGRRKNPQSTRDARRVVKGSAVIFGMQCVKRNETNIRKYLLANGLV